MSFFRAEQLPPTCYLNSKQWHEVEVVTIPSTLQTWLGISGKTEVYIRKDPFSQWYLLGDKTRIIPVSIERMLWLDGVWQAYGDQNDWLDELLEADEPDGA